MIQYSLLKALYHHERVRPGASNTGAEFFIYLQVAPVQLIYTKTKHIRETIEIRVVKIVKIARNDF